MTVSDVDSDLQAASSTIMSGHALSSSRMREESLSELNPTKETPITVKMQPMEQEMRF